MGKHILIICGDFTEELELIVPFQALQTVGHDVDIVSPGKQKGEKIKTAVHEMEEGDQTFSERLGHHWKMTADFEKIDYKAYHALLLPGGRGPEHLRVNDRVLEIVKYFADSDKPLAAICHAPQILAAAKVIKGRKLTAFPFVKPEIELAGGKYQQVVLHEAVVDGNLVTGPAPPAHPQWLKKFLDLLGTKISA